MLTPEQINNLNPGDKLALSHPLIFREYDSENDELLAINNGEYIYFHAVDVELPSEHGTSVPTPKHDPTRLFKKGDVVRVVAWNGRDIARIGQIGRVVSDEYNSRVELAIDGWSSCIYYPACHLELVTTVEELEPYSIDPANSNVLFKHGKKFATFEDDDEAQELCDRLNAEYRKEQK